MQATQKRLRNEKLVGTLEKEARRLEPTGLLAVIGILLGQKLLDSFKEKTIMVQHSCLRGSFKESFWTPWQMTAGYQVTEKATKDYQTISKCENLVLKKNIHCMNSKYFQGFLVPGREPHLLSWMKFHGTRSLFTHFSVMKGIRKSGRSIDVHQSLKFECSK